MWRALLLAIWIASVLPACGGVMPQLRKADIPALVDGLSAELDRADVYLNVACVVADHPACPKALDAMTRARAAVADAKARADRYDYAADRVLEALDAIAALPKSPK